jgi:hypothetical protein
MLTLTDRDLLIIDPSIFLGAAAAAGTVLLTADDGVISGTELESAGTDFDARGIDSGLVAVINDAVAVEVVSRTGATTLEVSLPRATIDDDTIPPDDVVDAQIKIVSFARLIDLQRTWILGALRVDDESAIADAAPVQHFLALRTIARLLAHAASLDPADGPLQQRAILAAQVARQAMHRTAVSIDLDGDGVAEVTRPLDVVKLVRG